MQRASFRHSLHKKTRAFRPRSFLRSSTAALAAACAAAAAVIAGLVVFVQ